MQLVTRTRLAILAVLVVAVGVAVAIVALQGGERSPRVSPVATTTVPPEEAPPEPVNIMLAGDSIMVGLAPAIAAALDVPEVAEVRFVLTPTVLRDPSVRFAWQQEMAEMSPDLVVMLVGVWEGTDDDRELAVSDDPAVAAAWQTDYGNEVLRPWVREVNEQGAAVLWLAPPPVEHASLDEFFTSLESAIESVAASSLQAAFLSGEVLGEGPDDVAEELTLPDGTTAAIRHIDGLHLCPAGAILWAEQAAEWIAGEFEISIAEGWQNGAWAQDQEIFPDHACG